MRMDIRDISRFSPAAQKQILAKLGKAAAPRESKYKSCRTPRTLPEGKVHTFDSKKEADRFGDLLMLMKAGKIRDLRLQVEFTLVEGYITVTGQRVKPMKYKADFTYEEQTGDGSWQRIIEDVKGARTKEYEIKRKLMLDKYGIVIREI